MKFPVLKFPYDLRYRHCYIPGKIGQGKSTQLMHFAIQDIRKNHGVTIIDPKGDLTGNTVTGELHVQGVIDYIPPHRKDDVIYIDAHHPIPFDLFYHRGKLERDDLVRDLTYLLLQGIEAKRAESYLVDALYTLLSTKVPTSFLDIYYFLLKQPIAPNRPDRFTEIIGGLEDWKLRERWKDYRVKYDEIAALIRRLNLLIRNSVMERALGTPKFPGMLNIADAINQRKILLINLEASETATDYGSLIFAKIKQEIFRRARTPKSRRVPHFIFIDEFQEFAITKDLRKVLNMARSMKLGMMLANPVFHELPQDIKPFLRIIGSYIIFQLEPNDVNSFAHLIPDPKPLSSAMRSWKRALEQYGHDFTMPDDNMYPRDLGRLKRFHAFYKLGDMEPVIKPTPRPQLLPPYNFVKDIKKRSKDYLPSQPPAKMLLLEGNAPSTTQRAEDPPTLPSDRATPPSPRTGKPPRTPDR